MRDWFKIAVKICFFLFCVLLTQPEAIAQNTSDESEVYLEFRHRGIINTVVISYYRDNNFYLPINEIFNLLGIENNQDGLIITGNFSLEQTPYTINLQDNFIRFGDETHEISSDDFLIKEIDFYLKPELFYDIFQLDFMIDFGNLRLSLITQKELPAIQKVLRNQKRRIADNNRFSANNYDLKFKRKKPFLDGGFVDYNLSANLSDQVNIYNYNSNIGLQLYGGDLQGSLFGSFSENFSNFSTNNLRWRRYFRDQNLITKLTIGQTLTDGVNKSPYRGVRFSNEPVEPRRLFDEFEVRGTTIPQSEVELYLNNALIDFQISDQAGDYRFLAPLTYGATQLDLRIYGPTGQIIERSNRIQVPFNFQPAGEFNYIVNLGELDNPLIGTSNRVLTAQGSGSYGLTDWLTAKAGIEYYEGFHTSMPTFISSLSSRLSTNYIFTLEGATDAFYRTTLNAVYPNSASFNVDFIDYSSGFSIYNPSNDDKRISSTLFYPFSFGSTPFNLRVSAFSRFGESSSITTFRADANSRFSKFNIRVGYIDRYFGRFDIFSPTSLAAIENSVTYTLSRNRNIPSYLKGTFLRAQMRYLPIQKEVESAQLFISRSIFRNGRFQFSVGRNFFNHFNSVRFSFSIDFNKIRSSSNFSSIRDNYNLTQNLRGSIGYDTNYNNFLFTSREQVGRSGTAVKLFVDNNNNGIFDEEDDPINENALRVTRSGAMNFSKNGVHYFTQMQPYFYYNMELNKGAIRNPMLVPEFEKFGLITDPNRFKKVEIPFYMSGVVEGTVERFFENGRKSGIAGLKVLITSIDGDFSKEIRTFSDGSFYSFEIPPGKYKLSIDQSQLDILDSKIRDSLPNFEVRSIPEGDFIEGLNIALVPKDFDQLDLEIVPDTTIMADIRQLDEIIQLQEEYDENIDRTLRLIIQAQTAFYNRDIDRALSLVNESLSLFETAQGYALKGSLYYLKGDKVEAQKNWDLAVEFNPDIFIPDIEVLDQLIRTQPGN